MTIFSFVIKIKIARLLIAVQKIIRAKIFLPLCFVQKFFHANSLNRQDSYTTYLKLSVKNKVDLPNWHLILDKLYVNPAKWAFQRF